MSKTKSNREAKRNCGTLMDAPTLTPAPAQEVLSEHGEIFSCGGVYLGLNRQMPSMGDRFDFLHLANHAEDVLVLNNQNMHRRPGSKSSLGSLAPQEVSSPEEALRRFFKESLN